MNGYTFTEDARTVLIKAASEAHTLNHEYVGTEHILLGIMATPKSDGLKVMVDLGVDVGAMRELVIATVKQGKANQDTPRKLPYTSRTKKSLELATSAAKALGLADVGSDHLLVGMALERKGIAAQVLADRGVTLESIAAKRPDLAAATRV